MQHNNTKHLCVRERERGGGGCAQQRGSGESSLANLGVYSRIVGRSQEMSKNGVEVVITKGQNPEHRDTRTLRLYCTFRKQQKSVHVTELGNGEGLKDTLDLK